MHTSELLYVFGNLTKYDIPGWPYHPTSEDKYLRKAESRSWSSFTAVGKPTLNGHDTLKGWDEADFNDKNYGEFRKSNSCYTSTTSKQAWKSRLTAIVSIV